MDHLHPEASGGSPPDVVSSGASFQAMPVAVALWDGGKLRTVEAYEGETLLVALKRAGLPLLAVCGGKGACGTCKVAFGSVWAAKLGGPERRELRLLTHLKAGEGDRLSCRITLKAELDGLEIEARNE